MTRPPPSIDNPVRKAHPLDGGHDDCPPPSSVAPRSPASSDALETLHTAETAVRHHTGLRLENLRVLEIGTRQDLRRLRRLALHNEVVGIDTDVTDESFHLGDYLRSLGQSPAMRAVKSLRRKMLGAGAGSPSGGAAAVARELGVTPWAPPRLVRMCASNLSFSDETFGFVCSFEAFERVDDPGGALREVARVLRLGGVAYLRIVLTRAPRGTRDPDAWPTGTRIRLIGHTFERSSPRPCARTRS